MFIWSCQEIHSFQETGAIIYNVFFILVFIFQMPFDLNKVKLLVAMVTSGKRIFLFRNWKICRDWCCQWAVGYYFSYLQGSSLWAVRLVVKEAEIHWHLRYLFPKLWWRSWQLGEIGLFLEMSWDWCQIVGKYLKKIVDKAPNQQLDCSNRWVHFIQTQWLENRSESW